MDKQIDKQNLEKLLKQYTECLRNTLLGTKVFKMGFVALVRTYGRGFVARTPENASIAHQCRV